MQREEDAARARRDDRPPRRLQHLGFPQSAPFLCGIMCEHAKCVQCRPSPSLPSSLVWWVVSNYVMEKSSIM